MSSANRRLVIFLSPMLALHHVLSGIRHDPFEKYAADGGRQKTALLYSDCCSEPFSYAAIHLDCSYSLIVELLNGAN